MTIRTPVRLSFTLLPLAILCIHSAVGQINEVELTATDGAPFDYFGWSLSLSGDYVLIGAHEDDDKGSNSGSAYFFHYDGSVWSQHTKVSASNGTQGKRFGWSAALSGDHAFLGVKANENGTDPGSVYFFHREDSSWIQKAQLTASDGAAGDWFGYEVSISGDYALIGAWLDDDKGMNSGSAYIFHYDGASWTQQTKLTASDGQSQDYFGNSVFVSGDYAFVGAWGDDDYGTLSGSAYVFQRVGSSWVQQGKLTPSDAGANSHFGRSLSIAGEYAIIGAPYHDGLGIDDGAAYIFHYNGSAWVEQAILTASDGAGSSAHFARSVSLSGNYAMIGTSRDDGQGTDAGAAYIFHYDGSAWTEQIKLTASDGAALDHFGRLVAISPEHAFVASTFDDAIGTDAGSVYVYSGFSEPIPLPGQVTLLFPADSTTVNSDNASFLWLEGQPEVDRYWLELATDSTFTTTLIDSGITDTTYAISQLQDYQTYWWRVRAHNETGWGPFSDTSTFYVDFPPDAPRLASPPDGALGVPATASFFWHTITQPDSFTFHLQMATDLSFTSNVVNDSTITDTSYQVGPLFNGTIYFWRVGIKTLSEITSWSEVWSFRTIVTSPGQVALLAPIDSAVVVSDSVTFLWLQGQPEIDRYWFELATDSAFTTTVIDSGITDTIHAVSQLQDYQSYWWKVRAHNEAGWGPFSQTRTFTVDVPPAPPLLISPLDGAINVPTTVSLLWHMIAHPDSFTFHLQLATDASFAANVVNDSTITDTSLQVGPLLNNTTYFWRVGVRTPLEVTSWSGTRSFRTIIPLPGQVTLVAPGDSAVVRSDNATFLWLQGQLEVDLYWFELATDSAFTTTVIDSGITDTTHSISQLQDYQTYWWRVRAHNEAGWGSFSETSTFNVDFPPAAPLLISPPNGTISSPATVSLVWQRIAQVELLDIIGKAKGQVRPPNLLSRANDISARRSVGADGPEASPDSILYHLQLATDSLFVSVVADDSTIADTSFQAGPLLNGTTYYWRVRGKDAINTTAWSQAWRFRTIVQLPNTVTLMAPADSIVASSDSVTFLWLKGEPEVDRYWFEHSTDSAFATGVIDSGLTDTTRVISQLIHSETYWWRVRAHNAAGWGPPSQTRTFTVSIPLTPLVLASPPNGALSIPTTVSLFWHPVDSELMNIRDASPLKHPKSLTRGMQQPARLALRTDGPKSSPETILYHLQLATDSLFASFVINDSTLADTSTQVGPLLNATTYFWRVRAKASGETTAWSPAWKFKTIGFPPDVTNIPDQTITTTGTFTPIRVDNYVSDPDNLDSQITWTVSGNSNLVFTWIPITRRYKIRPPKNWTGSNTVTFTATDPEGNTDSDSAVFTVTSLGKGDGGNEEVPEVFVLGQNYPNPFNPSTTIRYGVPVQSWVKLEVFTVLGERLALLEEGLRPAGYHIVTLNLSIASGIYFYRLEAVASEKPSDRIVEVRKLSVMR